MNSLGFCYIGFLIVPQAFITAIDFAWFICGNNVICTNIIGINIQAACLNGCASDLYITRIRQLQAICGINIAAFISLARMSFGIFYSNAMFSCTPAFLRNWPIVTSSCYLTINNGIFCIECDVFSSQFGLGNV